MSKNTKLLEKAYHKKIKAGTNQLTKVLSERLRLIPPEKQQEIIRVKQGPLDFEIKDGFAYMDIANVIYHKYGKPFLRYRFRLKGQQFDFIIEEKADGADGAKQVDRHSKNAARSSSNLVGLDGRPLSSGK